MTNFANIPFLTLLCNHLFLPLFYSAFGGGMKQVLADYIDYLVDWAIYIVQNKNLEYTKPQLGPVRKDPAQTIFS